MLHDKDAALSMSVKQYMLSVHQHTHRVLGMPHYRTSSCQSIASDFTVHYDEHNSEAHF